MLAFECSYVYISACVFCFLTVINIGVETLTSGGEYTFELPDNEKQCFYEEIDKNIKATLEYQVVTGGNYDVDTELTGPTNQVLYKDVKKQYDSFTWTTDIKGIYKFCFSNEFSTFTHKVVYFDFQVGDEKSIPGDSAKAATVLTQLETSVRTLHEALKVITDYQTHHKLREAQGRSFAEDLNEHVQFWSIGQTLIILIVAVGQILVLRSFFNERKTLQHSYVRKT